MPFSSASPFGRIAVTSMVAEHHRRSGRRTFLRLAPTNRLRKSLRTRAVQIVADLILIAMWRTVRCLGGSVRRKSFLESQWHWLVLPVWRFTRFPGRILTRGQIPNAQQPKDQSPEYQPDRQAPVGFRVLDDLDFGGTAFRNRSKEIVSTPDRILTSPLLITVALRLVRSVTKRITLRGQSTLIAG